MALFHQASAFVAALRSILTYQRCFELAANKLDDEALDLVVRTRAATRSNRYFSWDVELQLLEAYLLLEQGRLQAAQSSVRGVLNRIKSSTSYNQEERNALIRYAVSVLWLARGRPEPSCLLAIRERHAFDSANVRGSILRRFPNPDESASR